MGRVAISSREEIKFTKNELNNIIQLLDNKKYSIVKKRLESKANGKSKKKPQDGLSIFDRAFQFKEKRIVNQTNSEVNFESILQELNMNYEKKKIVFYAKNGSDKKSFFLLDFYLPEYKCCIEIDGGYHKSKEVKESDSVRTKILKKEGIWVIRFANKTVDEYRELTIKTLNERLDSYKNVADDKIKFDGKVYKKRLKK